MKKVVFLIICLCQISSAHSMYRSAQNKNTNTETMEIEYSLENHKEKLKNSKNQKLILEKDNDNDSQHNIIHNNNNSDEGDFTHIIQRPMKAKDKKKIKSSVFSKLVKEEYNQLKDENKILFKYDPRFPFFSPQDDLEHDDFSDIGSTFIDPSQVKNFPPQTILFDIISDQKDSSQVDSDEEYDFPELRELEYKLKKLEMDPLEISLDKDLQANEDDERPQLH